MSDTSSTISTDIVVIGSGSAGLVAAIGLSKIGYAVTLVERDKIGGDCTNVGCVPSKALLFQAKKYAQSVALAHKNGIQISAKKLAQMADDAVKHTRQIRSEFQAHESVDWLEKQGVSVVLGQAEFASRRQLRVTAADSSVQMIDFDTAVICTGSRPLVPSIDGMDSVSYLTNESVFELQHVPQSLLIVGNGAIGTEMAQAFSNLGSKVTIIGRSPSILPRSDAQVADVVWQSLQQVGAKYIQGDCTAVKKTQHGVEVKLQSGQMVSAEKLLIAIGRTPNTDFGLDAAGVTFSPKGIQISANGQTSNPYIFAVGDCVADVPRFTHMAGYMARQLVTNFTVRKYTKLPFWFASVFPKHVPAVTFSDIELAECGLTEEQARKAYGDRVQVYTTDFAGIDRALTHDHEPGMIKLVTVGFWGKIVGVHIAATRAGEILPEMQEWVDAGTSIRTLNSKIRAYPTYTTSLYRLGTEWLLRKISPQK